MKDPSTGKFKAKTAHKNIQTNEKDLRPAAIENDRTIEVKETDDPDKGFKKNLLQWVGSKIRKDGKIDKWDSAPSHVKEGYSGRTLRNKLKQMITGFTIDQLMKRFDVAEDEVRPIYKFYSSAKK